MAIQAFEDQSVGDSLRADEGYELVLITRGEGIWQLGEALVEFSAGFLAMAPPSALRGWRSVNHSGEPVRVSGCALHFSKAALPKALLRLPEMEAVAELLRAACGGLRFVVPDRERLLTRLRSIQRAGGALRYARFLAAMELIASFGRTQVTDGKVLADRSKARSAARWETVKRYLEQASRGSVSRAEAARVAGMDPAAFSRFFREQSGTTFVDYVANLRVRHAATLLGSRRDLTVAEVAKMSGFRNESSLHRHFKQRLGTTPHAYRRAANAEAQAP